MIGCLANGIFYVLVPYRVYQVAVRCTDSALVVWLSTLGAVPLAIFLYVRIFEWVKHGRRRP